MNGTTNEKKKQIGIVWANPYNKNLGVAALAYSALSILHDVLTTHNINGEITFFGSDKSTKDQIKIGNKIIPFKNIKGLDFYDLKWILKLLVDPNKHQLKAIQSLEYIFDIAEGDSFTDIYGNVRFEKIRNSKKYFGKRVKKQILLPQTIGPFKHARNEKSAFKAMQATDLIISRDKQSFQYTKEKLPKDKIRESIDVAFYLPYEKQSFNSQKVNVGINISGLLWNGGYTKNNQFGMQAVYQDLIREMLSFFVDKADVLVHLVPHVIPEHQPVEDDYIVSEQLQQEFSSVLVAPRFETPIAAKSYISGLDFFTGARMHACIAAFSSGVPVYPLAYSRKFNGLFVDTLNYHWLGDCVNTNNEEILAGLKDAFETKEELKKQIQLSIKTIVEPRLLELKKLLKQALES